MDISNAVSPAQQNFDTADSNQKRKEEVAMQFEKIFARKLVSEMTKDSFKMGDKNGVMGQSNSLYRHHIVDTLANEIAEQRKLGMADMISAYKKV
jgi:Rod binding domain-containing protein